MAGDANDEFDTAHLDERRGPQVPCLVLCLVAVREDYRNNFSATCYYKLPKLDPSHGTTVSLGIFGEGGAI